MNGNGHVADAQDRSQLLVISAKDRQSCLSIASGLRDHLLQSRDTVDDDALLDSLTYTLGSRRSRSGWSMAFPTHSVPDLIDKLGEQHLPEPKRALRENAGPRVGWVFTGQGAQWYAMGRELIQAYPVFKEAILECDRYIQEMGASWTVMGLLQRGEASRCPVIFASPTTGGRLQDLDVLSQSAHWVDSMLQPVEFEAAFRFMCFGTAPQDPVARQDVDIVLEIGPHGALGGPIRQLMTLPEFSTAEIPYFSCLSRGENAVSTMHRAAAELFCRGHKLDMDAINFPSGRLPDVKPDSPPSAPVWRHIIRVSDVPWVRHHMIDDSIVYPGAGFVTMAIEGFSQIQKQSTGFVTGYMLRDVEFTQALLIPDDEAGVENRLTIRPCGPQTLGTKDWHEFEVHSISAENAWASHCTGMVRSVAAVSGQDVPTSSGAHLNWQYTQAYTRDHVPEDLWAALRAVGIYHGPSFQNIHRIQRKKQESSIAFSIADIRLGMPSHFQCDHIIHPTTLDSAIQAAYTVVPTESSRRATIPRRISHLRVSASMDASPGHLLQGHTRLLREKPNSFEVDINVTDESGQVVEIQGLAFQSISSATAGPEADTDVAGGCTSWSWEPELTMLERHMLHDMMAVPREQSEVDLIMDLRRCTLHYIQEALASITLQDVEGMEWHHKKFHAWMKDKLQLAVDGQLDPGSADWASEDAGARESLRTRVAQRSVNGEMLLRLGPRIPSMLRREVAPLELMMQDQLLMRYYADALKWNRASQQASQLVRHCTHKNPRARVLEIGGGAGACTQAIFDALEKDRLATGELPLASYEFTDISSGFFEAARERFRPWQDTIRFETLDMFWALRGAGANFGIVASATYRVPRFINGGEVVNANFLYSANMSHAVFQALAGFDDSLGAELAFNTARLLQPI
ncbi:hypothetical protein PG988_013106 [Apiospora saccharicola]